LIFYKGLFFGSLTTYLKNIPCFFI